MATSAPLTALTQLPVTTAAPSPLVLPLGSNHDDDRRSSSTENGSSVNGDHASTSLSLSSNNNNTLDASSSAVLAAREKSLISRAMDTVARTVVSDEVEDEDEATFEVEGKMIAPELTRFKLSTPSPMPAFLNVHFICETASRLLFLSIHWVRSIPSFTRLR